MTKLTRRRVLTLTAGVATAATLPFAKRAGAADGIEAHGLSAFGDLAYPADFPHFNYVDPDAPKGGTFRRSGRRGNTIRISSPSIRSTATSSGVMRHKAWN
jgi:microcin C transport system substrate-binding protein